MNLETFVNDKFKILDLLYNHKIDIKGNSYTSLSQQEIANLIHFSKQKTNKLMKELMDEGYIDNYMNLRGKYVVTTIGKEVIMVIKNIEIENLGGRS